MELLSILNLVDLSEKNWSQRKGEKAWLDRKTTAIIILHMCSYVIFMQGASKNGGNQINNHYFVRHHCPVYAAVPNLQSLIFVYNIQALSNFFMCKTGIWEQEHAEKSPKCHLYPQALDLFTVSSKWIQMKNHGLFGIDIFSYFCGFIHCPWLDYDVKV